MQHEVWEKFRSTVVLVSLRPVTVYHHQKALLGTEDDLAKCSYCVSCRVSAGILKAANSNWLWRVANDDTNLAVPVGLCWEGSSA